ncbi:MAG: hypothetical protein PQJ58_08630 [Spirochaetales bacterium]|nr:hypothetical protein [Spirochaetales bacterium]
MSEDYRQSDEYYANKIFLNAVLPVLKTVVEGKASLQKGWKGKNGICQIRCMAGPFDEGDDGTHFLIEEGSWSVKRGLSEEKPDVELVFKSRKHLNNFFKGKQIPFPAMKGVFKGKGMFLPFMQALITMGGLLGSTKPPKSEEDQNLLVKCMFNLLSTGISTLNKLGHPKIKKWTEKSPDRVYAWRVGEDEDLAAYIRIKAGKSKASRGVYRRSMPFFTMKFDTVPSALGILLSIDDMIESTVKGKIIMEGAPEYGSQLGDHMLMIGALIQPG